MRSLAVTALLVLTPQISPAIDFSKDVYPLLQRTCFECHGPEKQQGGLRLDQRTGALRGGDSGAAIVAGRPEASELLRRISLPRDADEAMPPRGKGLSGAEVERLRTWIADGAVWPEKIVATKHWSYVKPMRPTVPEIGPAVAAWPADRAAAWNRHPLDRFVAAKLVELGLSASPEASRETLARRLALDLTGLPPTPAEVQAFLEDRSEEAYERFVDRLLASEEFGVKWARPWLDLARYADSHGFQRDDLRDVWAYRDWVVQALNDDLPFDRFTIEQLAGDLLPNATLEQRTATGFHRCTPTNVEAGTEPEESRINQVLDRVNTTGAVWLGTTLECAQCHAHKYDPFTQHDYYGLLAYFNNTEKEAERANPKVPGSIRFLGPSMPVPNPANAAERERLRAELLKLEAEQKSKSASDAPPKPTKATGNEQRRKQLERQLAALDSAGTLVMKELPDPRSTTIFQRGEYTQPGEPVAARTPAVLGPPPDGPPNRLTLARWLVSPDHPLTARVTVNRWWAELFGQGLVSTPEDFGVKGEPPSHPELLDWLAVEFVEQGWRMKPLLKRIVMSATYRQSSRIEPAALVRDDRNVWLARGPRFRLDAEAIRDNALAIAGLLSRHRGGPSIRPPQPNGLWVKVGGEKYDYTVSPGEEKYRRGLYVVLKRGSPYPSFVNFDATARLACVVKRSRSNTPLQALTLLNDPVYVEAALAFARRVLIEQPSDDGARIAHAFRLALARAPAAAEAVVVRRLLDEQRSRMERDPVAARQLIGTMAVPAATPAPEFAAWYGVATALLNLDESITKN